MEGLRILLIALACLVAAPVMVPVAMVQQGWTERRKRLRAEKTPCKRCGATLGEAALVRADAAWAGHLARLHQEHPHAIFRLVRHVWAVCSSCGQEHGYDEEADTFLVSTEADARGGFP